MGDGLVRCPDCGAAMAGRPDRCAACGLVVVGDAAARLWVVDQSIAALVAERTELLRVLRAWSGAGAGAGVASGGSSAAGSGATSAAAAAGFASAINASVAADAPGAPGAISVAGAMAGPDFVPASQFPPYPSALPPRYQAGRPRVEWSRRRVQNLLLSLGVLLLIVAALIFIAVNWGTLGAGGRAAVMAVVTVSAAGAATVAAWRRLPATAESVAALTVALLVVDSVGLRLAGFSSGIALATYAGATSAVIAVLAALWVLRVRLRTLRIAALIAAELVVPLATGPSVVHPAGVAVVYGLQVVALLVLRFHIATHTNTTFAALIDTEVLRVTSYIWWALSLIAAVVATYGRPDQRSAWGAVELVALAAIAVWTARHEVAELHLALATATGIAAACGLVPHLDASWRAPAVEAAALLAAVAVLLIPTAVARASTAVVAATGLGALLTAIKPIAEALAAPKAVSGHEIWNSSWPQIRSLRATDAIRTSQPWSGTAHLAVLTLAAFATAVVLAPKTRATARQAAVPAIAALVVVNLILVPLEAGWTLPIAVAWELALGALLVIAAVMKNPVNGGVAVIVGAGFLVHASLWSLRSPALTVMAVGTSLVVAVIAAVGARDRVDDRLVFTTLAALFVPLEAGLVAAYQGTSFEQTGVVLGVVAAALMMTTYMLRGSFDDVVTAALQVVALVTAATAIGFSAYEAPALAATTALLIVAAAPAVVLGREPLAPAWAALVQVLICLEADTVHRWITPGADLGSRALILALAASAASVVTTAFQRLPQKAKAKPKSAAVALITGPSIYALATIGAGASRRLDPVWLTLLIGGVAAALIATLGAVAAYRTASAAVDPSATVDPNATADRSAMGLPNAADDPSARGFPNAAVDPSARGLPNAAVDPSVAPGKPAVGDPRFAIQLPAAISSLLLLASSWVRLAESHVHSVEPYTVPAAVILLVAGYLRRRTDRKAASWPCYGPGLILGLTPTLIQALADPGLVRPVLVGIAALIVVVTGIRGRLQAPLAVGAAVLAIDAVAQLSPALAAAYDAVPRWTLIAMAGALLLLLGVTYERRIRDLRTLGRKFGELR